MDPQLTAALKDAATNARIIDPDLVLHPRFSMILETVASIDDVPRAIVEMRKTKANWFPQWADLDDRDFNQQEAVLLEGIRSENSAPARLGETIKSIDASRLSPSDFAEYERNLKAYMGHSYSLIDAGWLTETAHRQRGAA